MATLRPLEERDAKGNTIRINATNTYKQGEQIRRITGSNAWVFDPNPMYHEPVTCQAQGEKLVFFWGTPDTTMTRKMAREVSAADLEKDPCTRYIIESIRKNPLKVRQERPAVMEVRLATIGDVEVTEAVEVEHLTPDVAAAVDVMNEQLHGAPLPVMAAPPVPVKRGPGRPPKARAAAEAHP